MEQITRNQGELDAETTRLASFEGLEAFARQGIQRLLQMLLEEEVSSLLSRSKSERRDADSPSGYRNGHGEERRLSTSIGTVTVRRPRVRNLEERFVSRVLPLFTRRTQEVGKLLPELYLHGLSRGDFELAMRGLLGDGAPLSASSIGRLKDVWQAEYATWKKQRLDDKQIVYMWVDGIYVKAGLDKDKAALLVIIGARSDGGKEVLAVESGHRESEAAWSSLLRDLRGRGMNAPCLVIGDGCLGIWSALANVYPEASEQRCWNHRMRNVLDRVGQKKQGEAKELISKVMYAETLKEAEAGKRVFQEWAKSQQYEKAAAAIDEDWDRLVRYYSFPQEHWVHLRTTNVVESPFASVRLRTAASKRYKRVDGATAIIWKLLMVAQRTFRKLNAPDLLVKVYEKAVFTDGRAVDQPAPSTTTEMKLAV